jgi:ABC-type sulfate transport system substrate-binding protein
MSRRRIGDVLLAWENEAYLAQTEFGEGAFDIVYPPASILAEPPVALVDKNVDKRGTRAVAEAYLQFLYSKTAQEIEAKNHYRPRDPEIAARLRKHISDDQDVHGRTRPGRLASAPEGPLRRRRNFRSDLGKITSPAP